MLLPVATALIDQRVASFAAALMASVAKKYGGDPDHLAIITATMPDQETGRRRRFLVLHDTLRGGTGYLHRLADKDEFREVLQDAHTVVAECRCAERAGRPATAACSATSTTTNGRWSPAPRRCPCWTNCSATGIPPRWAAPGTSSLWDQVEERAGG